MLNVSPPEREGILLRVQRYNFFLYKQKKMDDV